MVHLQRIFSVAAGDILGLTVGIPIETRDILLADWARGREKLFLGLQIRFAFWKNLPHRMIGMASLDALEAQAAAS